MATGRNLEKNVFCFSSNTCRLAVQSIKQLHPDVMASVHAKALFSVEEEKLLAGVASVNQHMSGAYTTA